jgi:hypothetical protein
MSRRVHNLVLVLLLATSLSLSTPTAYAAATRDGGWTSRNVIERVLTGLKKLVKPLLGAVNEADNEIALPGPPKP